MGRPDGRDILAFVKKYAVLLVALAVGLVLILWPSGGAESSAGGTQAGYVPFPLQQAEEELAAALAEIAGAGRVKVVLTLKTDMTVVLQEDTKTKVTNKGGSESANSSENETKTVLIGGSNNEQPVIVHRIYPEFRGALVVCEGGASASVRLAVTQAVSALTGLGADKITVSAMK